MYFCNGMGESLVYKALYWAIIGGIFTGIYAQNPVNSVASGCALSFDGTTNRVEVPDANSLDALYELTLECWAYLSPTTNGTEVLIAKWAWCPDANWANSGQSYALLQENDSIIFLINRDGNYYHLVGWLYAQNVIPSPGYYHIAATFQNGNVAIYINGIKAVADSFVIDTNDPASTFCVPSGSCVAWCRGNNVRIMWCGYPLWNYTGILRVEKIYQGREKLRIGSNWKYCGGSGISSPFAGTIDEVRIWNYARSQTEIRRDMCRRLTGNEPGLVGYWRFDECSGNIAFDASGNGNHGTLY